ncbi:MAG: helix-turn-helix domain-containing protein [Microvirga sp.]
MTAPLPNVLPLRERKKELTRQAIRDNAERLFEARGYDNVTVAEIADAANISVKTLFTYIRSKEDLLFADTGLIDGVIASLRARPKAVTPAQAVAALLIRLSTERGAPAETLGAFQRAYGDSDALRSRLSRLWADYENAIAGELALQHGQASPDADTRLEAAQLAILIRSTTWTEFHQIAKDAGPAAAAALEAWLLAAARRIDRGFEKGRSVRGARIDAASR